MSNHLVLLGRSFSFGIFQQPKMGYNLELQQHTCEMIQREIIIQNLLDKRKYGEKNILELYLNNVNLNYRLLGKAECQIFNNWYFQDTNGNALLLNIEKMIHDHGVSLSIFILHMSVHFIWSSCWDSTFWKHELSLANTFKQKCVKISTISLRS